MVTNSLSDKSLRHVNNSIASIADINGFTSLEDFAATFCGGLFKGNTEATVDATRWSQQVKAAKTQMYKDNVLSIEC